MNAKQLGLEAVLVGFLGLNAYVIYQYGYIGFWEQALANSATVAALVGSLHRLKFDSLVDV